ncbi:uncharacterized protein LOC134776844 [Penaeus indicus]|uniref:uncharacterized protein LOC134776844 n=1 Tax=Penaeus indicus TaxID=29960 RepID=UPI00300DA86A
MAKAAFVKAVVWSVLFCESETWTMKADIIQRKEAIKRWVWSVMDKISWTETKTNEEVSSLAGEKRQLMLWTCVTWKRDVEGGIVEGEQGEVWGERGAPEKYVRVIKESYRNVTTKVRSTVGTTGSFQVKVGLHQGSVLSPFLFDIVLDVLTEAMEKINMTRYN